jgi:hypothetical protein
MKPFTPLAWRNLLGGAIVVGVMAVLTAASRSAPTAEAAAADGAQARQLRQLLSRAEEWSNAGAANPDPLAGLLHASYAFAYANAARELARGDDARLTAATQVDVPKLAERLRGAQAAALRRLATAA